VGGGLTATNLVSAFTYLGTQHDFLCVFADDLDLRPEFLDQFRLAGLSGWVLPTGALCLVHGPRSTPLRRSDVLQPDVLRRAATVALRTRGGPLHELAGNTEQHVMLVFTHERAVPRKYPLDWSIFTLTWEPWRCGWTGWEPKAYEGRFAWYQEHLLPKTWPPQPKAPL
jgi:hypothetical protein